MGTVYNGSIGNDTINAVRDDTTGQVHVYAKGGDDHINLEWGDLSGISPGTTNITGHHAYGHAGADTFEIKGIDELFSEGLNATGRIDDFDVSTDTIVIEGTTIDLMSPPSTVTLADSSVVDVRIVAYQPVDPIGSLLPSQQYILISNGTNYVMYNLEGARRDNSSGTNEERHFFREDNDDDVLALSSSADETFVDQVNYVPAGEYSLSGLVETIISTPSGTSYVFNGQGSNDDFFMLQKSASGERNNLEINGNDGNDVINSGQGNDTVTGGDGHDSIAGGLDADILSGNGGNDWIWGGSESDTLSGGGGNDRLFGGAGDDLLDGDGSNDTLDGNLGDDLLYGSGGNDSLFGSGGRDTLYGESGNDNLQGGHWKDVLYGGDGEDTVQGQNGNDTIEGGAAKDIATGGHGKDVFVFRTGDLLDVDELSGTWAEKKAQLDVITDFEIGDDKLDFSGFAGVNSRADLGAQSTIIDGNEYYYVTVSATNERVLVDVEDGTTWGEFFVDDNFIF